MTQSNTEFISNIYTFMKASGQEVGPTNLKQADLYRRLIAEEFDELTGLLSGGPGTQSDEEEIKEISDLIVVLVGLAVSAGYDLEGALLAVTQNNLSKIVDGVVLKDSGGKVQKPESYVKADMSAYVPKLRLVIQ